jgi:hypothetical protein
MSLQTLKSEIKLTKQELKRTQDLYDRARLLTVLETLIFIRDLQEYE